MSPTTQPLIRLESISKVFYTEEIETHALAGAHVDISKGEYVSISGPSGCGKSTLLAILGLLDTPTEGSYILNGAPVHGLDRAERTWRLVRDLPAHSRAVFTVPRPPVGCTGTTVKPLFLAAAHWKRTGRLPTVDITLVVDRESLLGVPDLDPRLAGHLRDLGVRVLMDTAVTALEPESKRITVTDHAGVDERIDYDMLHLVPPYRGPLWVQESGLAGEQQHGVVDIDSRTMRHRRHPEVWAAGDGAAIDTDSSGGALRKQISVLVDNLVASRSGGAMSSYDGYTVAPIAVEAHTLIAAEFDRTGALASSLPSFLDPLKPRRSAWAFDRYGLPQSYWHMILAGRL